MFASRGLAATSGVAAKTQKVSNRAPPKQAWDAAEQVDVSSVQSEPSSGPVSARSTAGHSADEPELPLTDLRTGRGLVRDRDVGTSTGSKDRRTAVSPFRSLPDLHPHEVELRVAVKDLSREVAPEKFRSRTKGVGGFVFGLLIFPQGTKSAPEHAKKNRPSRGANAAAEGTEKAKEEEDAKAAAAKKEMRWISAFVEARPSEDYPPFWYFEDVQFLVSLINFEDLKKSIIKHDKHTFSPVESSDGKAIDRGWHDFVHCDEATLRSNGFVDPKDDTVCFRASVYLAGGAMKVHPKTKSRYMTLSKMEPSGPYEKIPSFLNSFVQLWYHLGHFRNLIYGAAAAADECAPKNVTPRASLTSALREVFVRLQARTPPASCTALCGAFGRRMWSRICEAEPDAFCCEFFHALEAELTSTPDNRAAATAAADEGKSVGAAIAAAKKDSKAAKAKAAPASKSQAKAETASQKQKEKWDVVRELFECEVEWVAQSVDGGEFSDNSVFQGPVFTFVVRGFSTLEDVLEHYFAPKIVEDGSGLRVRTSRRFRRLPLALQLYLKRGDYDCCTGLCGLTDTYLEYPRQIDMNKYSEGAGNYVLYGVMVESDEHHWSYIRSEMEGDQGQWYRFDDRESSACAMSNATAIDASFGGEEWLCVNYLYGPSAVLTKPKESRACLLVYLKEDALDILLHEPRLPKISREYQNGTTTGTTRDAPTTRANEAEAAAAAQALLEEVDAQAMRDEKKRKQKQKKKQKEKEKKSLAVKSPEDEQEGNGAGSPEGPSEEDEPPVAAIPKALQTAGNDLKDRRQTVPRNASPDSAEETPLKAPSRTRRGASQSQTKVGAAASLASASGPATVQGRPQEAKDKASKDEERKGSTRDAIERPSASSSQAARPAQAPDDASTQASAPVREKRRGGEAQFAKGSDGKTSSAPANSLGSSSPKSRQGHALHTSVAASAPVVTDASATPERQEPAAIPSPVQVQQAVASKAFGGTSKGSQQAQTAPAVGMPKSGAPRTALATGRAAGTPASAATAAASSAPPSSASAPCPSSPSRVKSQNAAREVEVATPSTAADSFPELRGVGESKEGRSSPSSSSRAVPVDAECEGVRVFPEQLVTLDAGGALDDYAQFICKICKLVLRMPVVLPCAHMFCSRCFNQEVERMRPNVRCPTCDHAVKPQEVVHFEDAKSRGGALALLYRMYSGMKVRCVYHPDLLLGPKPPLTSQAERAKASHVSCSWRGALHDYASHLDSCPVHTTLVGDPSRASCAQEPQQDASAMPLVGQGAHVSSAASGSRSSMTNTNAAASASSADESHITGAYRAVTAWTSAESGAVSIQQGAMLWVSSFDPTGNWAYAIINQGPAGAHAWVPRALLQRAVYRAVQPFDSAGQAQGLSLLRGSLVHVYHREPSGWTYGARLDRLTDGLAAFKPAEVGWFPEACVADALPAADGFRA